MEGFDGAAAAYDSTFTNSCVGKAQRDQVWKYIDKFVLNHSQNVLEINCGTGEDAHRWKQREKNILATDVSAKMVAMSQNKYPAISFKSLDMTKISSLNYSFDTLFSNFGGLNCLSPIQLDKFMSDVSTKIEAEGYVVFVIMGKKCLWDQLYMIFKRRFKKRTRRNTSEVVKVIVDGETISTWYYSPEEIIRMAETAFETITIRPIGLFVPPSYLAPAFEKRKRLFNTLKWLDSRFNSEKFSNFADHFLIVLKRK